MYIKLATQQEVDALISDSVLPHTQRLYPRDLVFTARGHGGRLGGTLVLRPVYYAHSFALQPGVPRTVAGQLFDHVNGFISATRQAGVAASGCLFHVARDNGAMRGFIENRGAIAEPDSILYRLDQIEVP